MSSPPSAPAFRGNDRIPSLDGLRAVSIAMVLFFHAIVCLAPAWPRHVLALCNVGTLGVRVFFVISGFLITHLLIAEQAQSGRISLRRFYFRRTMRIFPPFYAYLAVIVVLRVVGIVDTPASAIAHAATYTTDYLPSSWNVGHTWSLSVEEQFYLFWPALVVALGPRRWHWAAVLIMLVPPMMRWWYPAPPGRLDLVADSLGAGCLLAGSHQWLIARADTARWMRSSWALAGIIAVVVGIEVGIPHSTIVPQWAATLVLLTVQNLAIAAVIHWCISNHTSGPGRLLNSAPFAFVGMISYSLYLWQQPFFNHDAASALTKFPLNLGAAVACALVSYYFVEQPALTLRRRLGRERAQMPTGSIGTGAQPTMS